MNSIGCLLSWLWLCSDPKEEVKCLFILSSHCQEVGLDAFLTNIQCWFWYFNHENPIAISAEVQKVLPLRFQGCLFQHCLLQKYKKNYQGIMNLSLLVSFIIFSTVIITLLLFFFLALEKVLAFGKTPSVLWPWVLGVNVYQHALCLSKTC